jgi:hypothetical protein
VLCCQVLSLARWLIGSNLRGTLKMGDGLIVVFKHWNSTSLCLL